MNEADTRAELIDPQLVESEWVTDDDVRVMREYRICPGKILVGGTHAETSVTDYVLCYKGVKLAVVEAKPDTDNVNEGVAQAKRDAVKLGLETSFATNGKEIYQICHKTGKEGVIDRFPTPEELWQKTFSESNEWRDKFNLEPFKSTVGIKDRHYYQEIAVTRALDAIANNEDRILLNLATGTGKTFIAFQIAWKLFQTCWNLQRDGEREPRILFLADRNILADQAFTSFGAFDDEELVRINPKEISKEGEVPKNGNIFFTIFQTFAIGEGGEKYFNEYDSDFFDLIIIDECHRGGADKESSWHNILTHFKDAVHLGLTATPKRKDNIDTYNYFGKPVFVYSLKDGIEDGFLTPFKVKRIQTTLDNYVYSPDDIVLQGEVEEGREYDNADFHKRIIIDALDRKRVQLLLKNMKPDEKTIVFCVNQNHAAVIRDMINQKSESTNVDYCVRVTSNDGKQGEDYLWLFRDDEKDIPTILTTSQKLTTGVDARDVRNIVLMRKVNMMIEFKQIIGRGTRRSEGKHYFTIIDFVGAHNMFNDPEWDGEPIEPVEVKDEEDEEITDDTKEENEKELNEVTTEKPDRPEMIHIELADGKERLIQDMQSRLFLIGGKVVDAGAYAKYLVDTMKLPEVLGDEEKLRKEWANPLTRKELLRKLEQIGCPEDVLLELQEAIDAQDSDLFDVLEYIAYAKPPISRTERVETTGDNIHMMLNDVQKKFVSHILSNYINEGVRELYIENLSTILNARYGSLENAREELGSDEKIKTVFVDFQEHLYKKVS